MTASKKPNHISGLLDEVFRSKGWSKRLGLYAVFQFWDKAVGGEVAKRAQPDVIRGTVLWVKVSDSVWMQQLHLQKSILLEKINQQLKGGGLSDIRFQLNASLGKSRGSTGQTSGLSPQGPDQKQIEDFDEMISSLTDPEVKEELKRLWLKFKTKQSRNG